VNRNIRIWTSSFTPRAKQKHFKYYAPNHIAQTYIVAQIANDLRSLLPECPQSRLIGQPLALCAWMTDVLRLRLVAELSAWWQNSSRRRRPAGPSSSSSAPSQWDGSPVSVLLLVSIIRKQYTQLAFHTLKSRAHVSRRRRQLVEQHVVREEQLTRMKQVWTVLELVRTGRQWLRSRCQVRPLFAETAPVHSKFQRMCLCIYVSMYLCIYVCGSTN
jgi:hypothetical protein